MTNQTLFSQCLENAKARANEAISEGMSSIFDKLQQSINTLNSAGQRPKIDVDEIVEGLNRVRDEWLNHVKGTFDTQISGIRQNLTKLMQSMENR